jgi:hypothetical protein
LRGLVLAGTACFLCHQLGCVVLNGAVLMHQHRGLGCVKTYLQYVAVWPGRCAGSDMEQTIVAILTLTPQ